MTMTMTMTEQIAEYRRIAARAGSTLRCLEAGWKAEDAPCVVYSQDEGVEVVRVQGPLVPWYADVHDIISHLDRTNPKAILLLIESPGGIASDGMALYEDLRARARDGVKVTAEARGVVASAATLPFLAADVRRMPTASTLMVHEPWLAFFTVGPVAEIEAEWKRARGMLIALRDRYVAALEARVPNASKETIRGWLEEETWFSPSEAVEAGVATDEVGDTEFEPKALAEELARARISTVAGPRSFGYGRVIVQTSPSPGGAVRMTDTGNVPASAAVDDKEIVRYTKEHGSETVGWLREEAAKLTRTLETARSEGLSEDGTVDLGAMTSLGDNAAENGLKLVRIHSDLSACRDLLKQHNVAAAILRRNGGNGADPDPDSDPAAANANADPSAAVDPRLYYGEPVGDPHALSKGVLAQLKEANMTPGGALREGASFRVDMGSIENVKATLFKTTDGYPPFVTRLPGMVMNRQRPIQVLDYIPVVRTNQTALKYMEETVFTNAAVEGLEGTALAESTLKVEEKDEPIRRVGTYLPVTEEQLDDEPMVSFYIDGRLMFMVRQRLDNQVLRGNGTAPNLSGILDRTGLLTFARGTNSRIDAVKLAMTKVELEGRAMPDLTILHHNDWDGIVLSETTAGGYYLGSPSGEFDMRIWGNQVVRSDILTENTGLVGAFGEFTSLHVRKDVEVEFGRQSDDFIKLIMTARAYARVGLCVYRPQAFCTMTGI